MFLPTSSPFQSDPKRYYMFLPNMFKVIRKLSFSFLGLEFRKGPGIFLSGWFRIQILHIGAGSCVCQFTESVVVCGQRIGGAAVLFQFIERAAVFVSKSLGVLRFYLQNDWQCCGIFAK